MSWTVRVVHHEEVDSTNRVLRDMAAQGAPEGTVVWADRQTAGRGRAGRAWHSGGDWGLWFSLLLRPASASPSVLPAQASGMLPISAGVGVARCLSSLGGLAGKVTLKWPNDVLLGGKKVCGVLCEAGLSGPAVDWAVIGIGINVSTPPGGFQAEIEGTATALDQHVAEVDMPARSELLPQVVSAVVEAYRELCSRGAEGIRASAMGLMSPMLGRVVTCTTSCEVLSGKVVGLAPDGALVLAGQGGAEFTVNAGDVHIGTRNTVDGD